MRCFFWLGSTLKNTKKAFSYVNIQYLYIWIPRFKFLGTKKLLWIDDNNRNTDFNLNNELVSILADFYGFKYCMIQAIFFGKMQ